MQFTKKQSVLVVFVALFIIAFFAGARFVPPHDNVLETVANRATEECNKVGISLKIGNKRTVGFFVKTFRFEDIVAQLNPVRLTFSSINATPSWKAYTDNIVDGKVTFKNVSFELPFFGAIDFGNGEAHLFVDKDDNIYISDFNFKGICGITGHLNIIKTQNLLDYSFTFAPNRDGRAFFLTLITLGVPFQKADNGNFILESRSKLQ